MYFDRQSGGHPFSTLEAVALGLSCINSCTIRPGNFLVWRLQREYTPALSRCTQIFWNKCG